MLNINKLQEPESFTNFNVLRNTGETFDDWRELDSNTKEELYQHILVNEQTECCAYCEQKFPYLELPKIKNYRIEHIYPRDTYKEKTFDYDNLIVTCDDQKDKIKTCDHSKANNFNSDLFINPVTENPSEFLRHNLADGEITPVVNYSENISHQRARYTIELLNLNAKRLASAREEFINEILDYITEPELHSVLVDWKETKNFPTLISQLLEDYEIVTSTTKRNYMVGKLTNEAAGGDNLE